jgi:hypothetical protein
MKRGKEEAYIGKDHVWETVAIQSANEGFAYSAISYRSQFAGIFEYLEESSRDYLTRCYRWNGSGLIAGGRGRRGNAAAPSTTASTDFLKCTLGIRITNCACKYPKSC